MYPSMVLLLSKWATPLERSRMSTFIYAGNAGWVMYVVFLHALRCASAVWATALCLSVRLCVCHRPALHRNGWTNLARFGTQASVCVSYTGLWENSDICKNKGGMHFSPELFPVIVAVAVNSRLTTVARLSHWPSTFAYSSVGAKRSAHVNRRHSVVNSRPTTVACLSHSASSFVYTTRRMRCNASRRFVCGSWDLLLDTQWEYRDERVCLSVCLSVCLFVYPRAYHRKLHQVFFAWYAWPWVDHWRRCDTLCTSSFVDNVMYAHNGQDRRCVTGVNLKWLTRGSTRQKRSLMPAIALFSAAICRSHICLASTLTVIQVKFQQDLRFEKTRKLENPWNPPLIAFRCI